jgi:hypothetical protein
VSEITVSTIHVADGRELGESPQVFVQDPPKYGLRTDDTLIVFLDLPNASVEVCNELSRTLSKCYYQSPGGITTGLRLAVRLASEKLNDFNRGLIQPVTGSLSCAVISNDSVVIGQCGPAIAYARAPGGSFERVTPPDDQRPVGVGYAEMFFVNFAWQPGDSFVLTGPRSLSPDVSDRLINVCMGKGDARMVAGYLNANIKAGRMTGVSFTVNVRTSIGEIGELPDNSAQATNISDNDDGPSDAVYDDDPANRLNPSPAKPAKTTNKLPKEPKLPVINMDWDKVKATFAPIGAIFSNNVLPALGRARDTASNVAGRAAESAQRGASTIGRQMLPSDIVAAQSERPKPSVPSVSDKERRTRLLWMLFAILLPVIVAWLTTTLYLSLSGEMERKQLRDQTTAIVEAARAPNAAPDLIQKAIKSISNYQSKVPEDRSFEGERQQLSSQLDKVLRVTRVKTTILANLPNPAAIYRVAATDQGVYLLNTVNSSAEQYLLNSDRNGLANNKPMALALNGNPNLPSGVRDVAWATQRNGRWGLADGAMLFGGDGVYFYNANNAQIAPIKLPATTAVNKAVAGELYSSQFYILDAGAGQLWRYQMGADNNPRGSGYFMPPLPSFPDAVDVAIDGNVYVLRRNAQEPILRYNNARPTPFKMNGLPQSLVEPVAITLNTSEPNTGFIYIGDTKLGLVIQLNKDGEFVRQFRAEGDDFQGLQDISIDPATNTLYVVTPTKLLMLKID